jgi:hypothetical protein
MCDLADQWREAAIAWSKRCVEHGAEIEQLRAALQQIADEDNGIPGGMAWAALQSDPGTETTKKDSDKSTT